MASKTKGKGKTNTKKTTSKSKTAKTIELSQTAFIILIVLAAGGLYMVYTLSKGSVESGRGLGKNAVAVNDVVVLNFVSRLSNGSIVDTTIEQVAIDENIYSMDYEYSPIIFTVGKNQIIAGIDSGVIGLREGETKKITVPPEAGFGEYNEQLIQPALKIYPIDRYSEMTLIQFQSVVSDPPQAGETIVDVNVPWPMEIVSVTDELVSFLYTPGEGAFFETSVGLAIVVNVSEDKIWIMENPVDGSVVSTQLGSAIVKTHNETMFLLDYNHPLAGKTLHYEVTVEGVVKLAGE